MGLITCVIGSEEEGEEEKNEIIKCCLFFGEMLSEVMKEVALQTSRFMRKKMLSANQNNSSNISFTCYANNESFFL